MNDTDVLIVGAGPTGLVLALWLTRQGVRVRVIDKTEAPGTTSRALAVHARTLELYRQLDLAEAVLEHGHETAGASLWVRGERVAQISFADMGAEVTPYPFLHIFPQDEHERLLIDRLAALGIEVERRTELAGFVDAGDHIEADLQSGKGSSSVRAAYIAGCDGASSTVRRVIGGSFPGGTYRQLFYVADIEAAGPPIDGRLNVDLDEADFLAVFPLAGEGRARLIGTVRDDRADRADSLRFEDVSTQAMERLKLVVRQVNWFSTYHVHHRVTDRFREGRAFLLGDAAHIHSPAGGQGMNTGIGDAINLAWKLAAVLRCAARDSLLDTYDVERIAFARRLVASTDRGFKLATAEGRIAEILRTRIFPHLAAGIMGLEAAREYFFRTISQITLNYRHSPLSRGAAAHVRGGDRAPWVRTEAGDNYESLRRIGWQAHVYGEAKPDLRAWCVERGIPLEVFPWRDAYREAGLGRDAAYLLRPDTYVAVADPGGGAESFANYVRELGIEVGRPG